MDPAGWFPFSIAKWAAVSIIAVAAVENSAISFVPRISTDGTQVVVVVSLNERWPDESRKQVVLVGTPKG